MTAVYVPRVYGEPVYDDLFIHPEVYGEEVPGADGEANAEVAAGSGTAANPSTSVAPNAGHAAGAGSAFDATVSTGADAEANAEAATGSGSAFGPSASVETNAGLATGTGAAGSPSPSVGVNAGHASGAGTAYDATAVAGTSAAASVASGTGAAFNASVNVQPNAGVAEGQGDAYWSVFSTPGIVIQIAGSDYAQSVLFSTARFVSQVNGHPGEMYMRLRDPDRTLDFPIGTGVLLKINGEPIWRGFVMQQKRVYVFPALNVDAFGETRFLDLIGVDINVLFTKRIVFNQADPEVVAGKLYPPFQADDAVIADLVADYLDLSSDTIDTSTFVDNVGDITEDQEGRAWSAGDTWGQAMGSIAMLPAAIFYLRPTLAGADLVYCDVDTPNADYAMSDVPGPGIAGYREMEVLLDGTGLVNDQLAWGMGYGSNVPVFVRDEDAASQAEHGLWQAGTVRYGIYKQATINRVAASIVDGSPQSKRGAKDDRVAVTVSTYVPGFLPSQKIDFTSEVWGFNDVIPIRKMEVTFEAPDTPKFALTLSHEIDTPFGFVDPFFFDLSLPPLPPLPPFPTFPGVGECTPAICGITDDFERTEASGLGIATCGLDYDLFLAAGSTAEVDGDAAVLFATDDGTTGLSASLNVPTVPWDNAVIHTMRFQLPTYDSGWDMTFRWRPGDFPGVTAGPNLFIRDSSSSISWVTSPGTSIPTGFWNDTSTYTWTIFRVGGSTRAQISDGTNSYFQDSGTDPTEATCDLTMLVQNGSTFPTIRVLDIDIPEITRCALNTFDDFNNRTETSIWGTASSGAVWDTEAPTGTTASVHGGAGELESDNVNTLYAQTALPFPAGSAFGMFGVWQVTYVPVLGSGEVYTLAEYGFWDGPLPFGDLMFNIGIVISNTSENGGGYGAVYINDSGGETRDSSFSFSAGVYYTRIACDGSSFIQVKVWRQDEDEPEDWTVERTVPSDAADTFVVSWSNVSDHVGDLSIFHHLINFDYDGKPCYTGACAAPTILDTFNRTVDPGLGTATIGVAYTYSGDEAYWSVDGARGVVQPNEGLSTWSGQRRAALPLDTDISTVVLSVFVAFSENQDDWTIVGANTNIDLTAWLRADFTNGDAGLFEAILSVRKSNTTADLLLQFKHQSPLVTATSSTSEVEVVPDQFYEFRIRGRNGLWWAECPELGLMTGTLEGPIAIEVGDIEIRGEMQLTGAGTVSPMTHPNIYWNDLQISGLCSFGPAPSSEPPGPTGYVCEDAVRQSQSVYTTTNAFVAASSKVYINGLRQRRGGLLDYTEDPPNGEIIFTGPEFPEETADVRVCYYIAGPL